MASSRFWLTGLALSAALGSVALTPAAPIKRAQTPSVSPDGKTLLFSWQDDLWSVPVTGGRATRLTVHPAADTAPRWFPDGKRIAFVSNRYGNNDLFTMSATGEDIRRVTFGSSTEYLWSVSADGKNLFGYTTAFGRINPFCVPASGGDLIALNDHPLELTYFPSPSLDGKQVVYNIGGSPGNWRNPRKGGSDSGEIWVGNLTAPIQQSRQLTKDEANDVFPMWGPDNRIYFISNRGGTPEMWSMTPQGQGAKKLTDHGGGTLRWPSMSPSGHVAYEYDSEVFVLDIKSGATKKVTIDVPDDERANPILDLTLSTGATDHAVSPDGKRGVIAVRGELFLLPERGGTTRRLTTHAAMDTSPVWVGNDRILFVTGRNKQRELMTVDLEGKERLFLSAVKDLTNPVVSPDGKMVAFHAGDQEIMVAPAAGGAPKSVAKGTFYGTYLGGPSFSWSPDSKWITYASDTERGSNIHLVNVETGKSMQVARAARGASNPRFLPNGKAIFYNTDEFDTTEVMIVDLVEPEVTFTEDDLDQIDVEKPKPGPVAVEVQERNLMRRVRRLTNGGANALLASPDSRSIWAMVDGQLSAIPVSGGAAQPVAAVTGPVRAMALAANGSKVYLQQVGGRLAALNLQGGQVAPINYSARMQVNRKAEEMELFYEIWWAMNRMYYDPAMHGRNWQAIQAEYAALVPFVYDRQDFYSLMNEMIEELDSSHLSISRPPSDVTLPSENTAWLGIDLQPAALMEGRIIVGKVFPGTAGDRKGSQLLAGDEILRVDGEAVGKGKTLAEALKDKAGRKVRLNLRRGGQDVEITIKPDSSGLMTGVRYDTFVEERRAEVEKLSGGEYTYFHIQGMNDPSTEQFLRDIRTYGEGKKGAVVDVRWNGGGNTANRILAALKPESWLNREFRWMPGVKISEEMFRGNAIEMPTVILTNQYSASNAEIFSEGFRRMKLGPVVGEPTGGNVLTVAGRYGLWDGGGVQIPFIKIVTVDGESLEGKGRRVDVDVRYDPNAWASGRDVQVERAVSELKKRR